MSLTGKGTKSLRRKDVKEQKSIAVGFKKLVLAHKATAGDTGINLTSLATPSEMSSLGFTNPTSSEILSANLKFFRSNLKIVSSHKGILMDYLSYNVTSSSRIDFVGFTAEADEIFLLTLDANARTGVQLVDASPLTSTGTLAVGTTDYNVGQPFEVNKYPVNQVGAVLVFRNGQIQFRNPNNGTTGGNYQELQAGGGLGTVIRFNSAPVGQEDNILVVSNGLLAYRPDGSLIAEIETLAGQLDTHREILETVTGTPVPPGAPNNVDLKAFGDRVLQTENELAGLLSRLERTRFHIGPVAVVNELGLTNTAFEERNLNITFTPEFTGIYKVSAKASIQFGTANCRVVCRVQNTAGGASTQFSIEGLGASDSAGAGDEQTTFPWTTFQLTAGQTYTFALFTRTPNSGTYVHVPGNNDNGSRMWAEYVGPVEDQ